MAILTDLCSGPFVIFFNTNLQSISEERLAYEAKDFIQELLQLQA